MIRDDEEWTTARNSILPDYADITVKPVQRDAGYPADDVVYHRAGLPMKLFGTFLSIQSARPIPIATVPTPARYANPTPSGELSPSTASAQMNGPTTAAARDDKTIRLKNRPA